MPTKETAGAAMSALGGKSGAPSLGSLLRVWHSKHANPDTNRLSRDPARTHPDPDRGILPEAGPTCSRRPAPSASAPPALLRVTADLWNRRSSEFRQRERLRRTGAALRPCSTSAIHDQIPNLTDGGTSRSCYLQPAIGENSQYEGETPDSGVRFGRRPDFTGLALRHLRRAAVEVLRGLQVAFGANAAGGIVRSDAGAHAVLTGRSRAVSAVTTCAPAVCLRRAPDRRQT